MSSLEDPVQPISKKNREIIRQKWRYLGIDSGDLIHRTFRWRTNEANEQKRLIKMMQ